MYSKSSEDKKRIQKIRMMGYFIEAAHKIIEEEGFEYITIRKVSDIAGYNSATIYNYFENLDHLICFASMKYLREYSQTLSSYTKGTKNSVEKFLNIWRAFCIYSFKTPKVFYTLFFDKFSHSLKDIVNEYYEIFPEDLGEHQDGTLPMLLKQNLFDRNKAILLACVDGGFVKSEDIDELNEMIILIYQGMLERILKGLVDYSVDEATERVLNYIRRALLAYQTDHSIYDLNI